MPSFTLRPRVALAGALVVAGVLVGAVAAGAATADPSPSGAATAEPSESGAATKQAERKAEQTERKAEQTERKAERKAEQAQRKAARVPGPAEDQPGARAVTGPPFVCDPERNHGENVSAYARSLPKGPGRGRLVSQAARSDCGKPATGD